MNPSAILALLSQLYEQVAALTAENERLRQAAPTPEPQQMNG